MKKMLLVISLVVMVCFPLSNAKATPGPFFTVDNFTLTYGAPGNPGAAGSTFTSFGSVQLLGDLTHTIKGWYDLAGITSGAQLVGSQYITDYAGTLNLWADIAKTSLLWTGTGDVFTIINTNGSVFNNTYPSNYSGQPTTFNSIGYGNYIGAGIGGGGVFGNVAQYNIPWLGTFNWAPDNVGNGHLYGNAQGELNPVPEPATMLLLGSGLIGLAGLRKKFRKC